MKQFQQLLLTVCLFSSFLANGQRNCASAELHEKELLTNPAYKELLQQAEEQNMAPSSQIQNDNLGIITIQVVFHIIYHPSYPAQNVSDEQIMGQLDVMNKDFRRQNTDANNYWSQAADTQIQFILATKDPNGQATTGITRTATTKTSFLSDNSMKTSMYGKAGWDRTKYMNIWVCNLSDYLGYATFPGTTDWRDGIVIAYWGFGVGGNATAPFNLGRTATHEIGHYLNLYHIWGDNSSCSVDDLVADTPNSDGPNFYCQLGHISCGSEDMVANYMDYSDDACMNLFTAGQKSRMRSLFQPGGLRASLPVKDLEYRFVGPGTNWNTATNWAGGLIPPANYLGNIYIDSDCIKPAGIEIIPPKQIIVASNIFFQVNGN